MKRFNYYITDSQSARLKALAEATGLTQSELIRRYIDEGLDRDERKRKQEKP